MKFSPLVADTLLVMSVLTGGAIVMFGALSIMSDKNCLGKHETAAVVDSDFNLIGGIGVIDLRIKDDHGRVRACTKPQRYRSIPYEIGEAVNYESHLSRV